MGAIQDTSSVSPFLSVIDLGVDDRTGYGVDEDVIVNTAGNGTDLIHGVEAGLHRLAGLLTLAVLPVADSVSPRAGPVVPVADLLRVLLPAA